MPTKRTFDLIVITTIFLHPVVGLAKMWATRKVAVDNTGPVTNTVAGAARIIL